MQLTHIPMHPGTVLLKSQLLLNPMERESMKDIPYQSLLSALWYLETVLSPEMVFPLLVCMQFAKNPGPAH